MEESLTRRPCGDSVALRRLPPVAPVLDSLALALPARGAAVDARPARRPPTARSCSKERSATELDDARVGAAAAAAAEPDCRVDDVEDCCSLCAKLGGIDGGKEEELRCELRELVGAFGASASRRQSSSSPGSCRLCDVSDK